MKQQPFNVIRDIELFMNVVLIANKRICDLISAPLSIKYINEVVRQHKQPKEEILSKYLIDLHNDSIIGPLLKNNELHYAFHWVNGFEKLSNYKKITKYLINKYETENNPDDFFRCLYEISFYNEKELTAFIYGCKKSLCSPENQKYLHKSNKQSKLNSLVNKLTHQLKNLSGIAVLYFVLEHYGDNALDYFDDTVIKFTSSFFQDKNQTISQEETRTKNLQYSNQKKQNKFFPDPDVNNAQKEQEKGSGE